MTSKEVISNKESFLALRSQCEELFDTKKRLPDFVFRHKFPQYCAIEYRHVYGKVFGELLSSISCTHGDESINYMTLDPEPDSYYHQSSFYGLTSFRPSEVVERYVPILHPTQGASHLLAGANVGVFWGSSLKWGIACDRISWELAVIAVPENIDVLEISGLPCMDIRSLSDYMKNQYSGWGPAVRDSKIENFIKTFEANYAI